METKHHPKPTPVDYTNLYIKNLDLDIESMDLFTHFRVFGKIVSARVMRHPQTNQSRGFGFVSFSRAEDALRAKQEMNGQRLGSKPMVVAFHEPKKSSSDSYSTSHSAPAVVYRAAPPPPPPPITLKRQVSAPTQQQPIMTPSGLFIPPPPPHQQRPILRRSGSIESAMTDISIKRQAITKAIFSVSQQEQNIQDIVDMLLTLKRKDLATCLFNKSFLMAEIKRAKEALDIFPDEESNYYYLPNIEIPPRCSRAIPIVAPNDAGVKETSDAAKKEEDLKDEIEKFLDSLKGLSLYEQKQLLGDRLFPLVKATGIKHAPRVTICLLDSIAINELAHSMYDKQELQQLVNKAANK
ncbi:hypothetical protein G6F43_006014 [Rhizopus delemar]|nr:hypothetical protein G6F43_006014 [Rhizopus delemar]